MPVPVPEESLNARSGRSRGAIFRVAGLFLQQKLGRQWYRSMLAEESRIGELLMPTLPPDSWQRTSYLLTLLDRMQASEQSSPELYQEFGAHVASATVTRLFGADPKAQSPASMLKAAESF